MAIRYGVLATECVFSDCLVDVDLRWQTVPVLGTFLKDEGDQIFVVNGLPITNYETGKRCTLLMRSVSDVYPERPKSPIGELEISYQRP